MYINQDINFSDLLSFLRIEMEKEGWKYLGRGADSWLLGGNDYMIMECSHGGYLILAVDKDDAGTAFKLHFNMFPEMDTSKAWYAQSDQSRGTTSWFYNDSYLQNVPLKSTFTGHFWINAKRIMVGMEHNGNYLVAYAGRIKPYGSPSDYPYPFYVSGTWPQYTGGKFANAYPGNDENNPDSTTHELFDGSYGMALPPDGLWRKPSLHPCHYSDLSRLRLTLDGKHYLMPITVTPKGAAASGFHGTLDGVYRIPGINLTPGEVMVLDGKSYLIVPDVHRRGAGDYFAIETS